MVFVVCLVNGIHCLSVVLNGIRSLRLRLLVINCGIVEIGRSTHAFKITLFLPHKPAKHM